MTRFPSSRSGPRTGVLRVAVPAVLLVFAQPLVAQRGPAPAESGLPADVLNLACAPFAVVGMPPTPLRITGGQDSFTRRNYQPGDLVTINAGSSNGIKVGDEFFVRRPQVPRDQHPKPEDLVDIRTAGWIRVYAVDDTMSLATISQACDTIEVGDYLEPFKAPQPLAITPTTAKPEKDNYAHITRGTDLRWSFGKGDYFLIDRGSIHGITTGAQFVIYRNKHEGGNFLFELGEAVAVDVGPKVATLQVTVARDAFSEGDLVALRK